MRKPCVRLLLASVVALEACSTCATVSEINVRPQPPLAPFEQTSAQAHVTRLIAKDALVVLLRPCGERPNRALCAFVRLAPGHVGRFAEASFRLTDVDTPNDAHPLPQLSYQELCQTRSGKRECSSDEANPSAGPLAKVLARSGTHKEWSFELWDYAILPDREFVGAVAESDPAVWRLFSESANWREYGLRLVPASSLADREATLELPDFILDREPLRLPIFRVRLAPTKICPVYA